ncbi:hypothetical protein GQ54DRAFT_8681 [Martensiomyces pterosporus]|nr:hypothetical protein GQ54DRAFT_8681 [Martensiomyces pterosporus]
MISQHGVKRPARNGQRLAPHKAEAAGDLPKLAPKGKDLLGCFLAWHKATLGCFVFVPESPATAACSALCKVACGEVPCSFSPSHPGSRPLPFLFCLHQLHPHTQYIFPALYSSIASQAGERLLALPKKAAFTAAATKEQDRLSSLFWSTLFHLHNSLIALQLVSF